MVGALEGYPFHKMTERYSFRAENDSNWKVFSDAFQEYYHVPPLHTHQLGPTPEARNPEYEFEGAHYQLDGPHRMVTTSGTHKHNWPAKHLYPTEALTRSGSTGPWDAPDLGGKLPGVNPSGISRWGIDNFQVFPNLEILIYERGWYVTYRYWPTSHNTHVFEGDLHFVPARNARERLAHEYAALTFKEYGLQDCGTLDGTQMGLEQGAFRELPAERPGDPGAPLPQDRRRLGRRATRASGRRRRRDERVRCFRRSSRSSSRGPPRWCLATEPERWAQRLRSSMEELQAFYDAFFPRAEEAIA